MIFQHTWQQVLNGTKTQSRRIVNDSHVDDNELIMDAHKCYNAPRLSPNKGIQMIFTGAERGTLRRKWQVGNTYAVQPGRGKKQVGRIRLLTIRQERLQDISEADAIAEGVTMDCPVCNGYGTGESLCKACQGMGLFTHPIDAYAALWDNINTRNSTRWEDNPLVWVLELELVNHD